MVTIGRIGQAGASLQEQSRGLLAYLQHAHESQALEELRAAQEGAAPLHYWQAGSSELGRWRGSLAAELGLPSEVSEEAFVQAFTCQLEGMGKRDKRAQVLAMDVVFSAPKSVSLLFALSPDQATRQVVLDTVREAAEVSADYLARNATFVRIDRSQQDQFRAQRARTLQAQFIDLYARPVTHADGSLTRDPDLHVHMPHLALAQAQDGRWRQLHTPAMYQHAKTAGVVGQAYLQRSLEERLGVKTRSLGNGTFELEDLADPLWIEAFSQRRGQIEAEADRLGVSSRSGQAKVALATRQAKSEKAEVSTPTANLARALAVGLSPEHVRAVTGQLQHLPEPRVQLAPQALLERLTEEVSVFTRRELIQMLRQQLTTSCGPERLEQAADQLLADTTLVTAVRATPIRAPEVELFDKGLEQRWSTPEVLRRERQMLRSALERAENWQPLSVAQVEAARTRWEQSSGHVLTDDQVTMVEQLLASAAGLQVVEGRAGTGKTAALAVLRDACASVEVPVVGCALAGKAALQLQEDAGIRSWTLAEFIPTAKEHGLAKGTVIVCDEAGMVGGTAIPELVQLAERCNGKLVLVGDRAQFAPVGAGASFKALGDRLGRIELTTVLRQKEAWQKEAALAIREHRGQQAYQDYKGAGAISSAATAPERRRQMAVDWLNFTDRGKDVLILARTNDEVTALNEVCREAALQSGRLSMASVKVPRPGQDPLEIRRGDVLLLTKNWRGLRNGHRGEVTELLRNQTGQVEGLRLRSAQREIELDLRRYRSIERGFAVTDHKAQGATADVVLAESDPSASAQSTYVELTRQREIARVYQLASLTEAEEAQRALPQVFAAPGGQRQESVPGRSGPVQEPAEALRSAERGAETAAAPRKESPVTPDTSDPGTEGPLAPLEPHEAAVARAWERQEVALSSLDFEPGKDPALDGPAPGEKALASARTVRELMKRGAAKSGQPAVPESGSGEKPSSAEQWARQSRRRGYKDRPRDGGDGRDQGRQLEP